MSGLNKVRTQDLALGKDANKRSDRRGGSKSLLCRTNGLVAQIVCAEDAKWKKGEHKGLKNVEGLDQISSHQPQYEITTEMKENKFMK